MVLTILRLAIAGDLHGSWFKEDQDLLIKLQPDGVLFVGDLGEGDLRLVKSIKELPLPTSVILGNHDRGADRTGDCLRTQLKLLGDIHCGWKLRNWDAPDLSIVGARPCSAGGGFYLSKEVKTVFGALTLQDSVERIVNAARSAPTRHPLVILAHCGPTGLGSTAESPCGRDWKLPEVDWGDQDLSIAIKQIRKFRIPELVVFGHMHHGLKRGGRERATFSMDSWGTAYLNAACVPRRLKDSSGNSLCHLSWAEFEEGKLSLLSHRWFRKDTSIASQKVLFKSTISS